MLGEWFLPTHKLTKFSTLMKEINKVYNMLFLTQPWALHTAVSLQRLTSNFFHVNVNKWKKKRKNTLDGHKQNYRKVMKWWWNFHSLSLVVSQQKKAGKQNSSLTMDRWFFFTEGERGGKRFFLQLQCIRPLTKHSQVRTCRKRELVTTKSVQVTDRHSVTQSGRNTQRTFIVFFSCFFWKHNFGQNFIQSSKLKIV